MSAPVNPSEKEEKETEAKTAISRAEEMIKTRDYQGALSALGRRPAQKPQK